MNNKALLVNTDLYVSYVSGSYLLFLGTVMQTCTHNNKNEILTPNMEYEYHDYSTPQEANS